MSLTTKKDHPHQFTVQHWWQVVQRVYRKIEQDNMSLIAAGVAFYFLLAIFPLLASLISMYGLFVDHETVNQHIGALLTIMPEQSGGILKAQIESLTSTDKSSLSLSLGITFIITLWSGGKGSVALITACNISYKEPKSRSFVKMILLRLLLTLAMVLIMMLMLILVVGIPIILSSLIQTNESMLTWVKWPILLLVFNLSLAGLYKYAPHRNNAKWRWVTPGATVATLLWLIASYMFNVYISEYADYSKTYGSMGGVVILLMWFYMTAYTILLGAATNAATELQTGEDTTRGDEKPKGQRGAFVANNSPDDLDE